MEHRDLVIVGAGPAGLAASIYARRSLMNAITLEQESLGGQLILSSTIDNYPGCPRIEGYDLAEAMRKQAEDLGAEIRMDTVQALDRDPQTGHFTVTATTASYDAAAVILAAGARPRPADFEGEERFTGHGVSYCAACDGMFYRDKHVFVVGGGNSAVEEALFLARLANKVTLIVRKDHLRAQRALVQELEASKQVNIMFNTQLMALDGSSLPSSLTFMDTASKYTWTETYDEGSFGIFVLVGRDPQSELARGLAELNENGYIITDERMTTRTPGFFVAGDVREKPLRQIVTAASDGAIAATSAAAYLGHSVES